MERVCYLTLHRVCYIQLDFCITEYLHHSDSVSLFHIMPVSINLLVWYFSGCCLACQCSSCPCQAAGRSLPPFPCRNSQALWSWHVRKISATSWGDWRIGNTKTSATKAMHISLNPIRFIMKSSPWQTQLSFFHPSICLRKSFTLLCWVVKPFLFIVV